MDTLSGSVGPGPQEPETGQAWHGPTHWAFPLGLEMAPGFWTCFPTQIGSRGGAGWLGRGRGGGVQSSCWSPCWAWSKPAVLGRLCAKAGGVRGWQEMKLGELGPSGHLNPPGLPTRVIHQGYALPSPPRSVPGSLAPNQEEEACVASNFSLWALSPPTPHPAGRYHQWIHPLSKLSVPGV